MAILLLLGLTVTTVLFAPPEREQDRKEQPAETGGFGEPLPWNEVELLFPRYTAASVTDLKTGKSFAVERRGGTYHADVQPLTDQDTRIFKEIYGDEWSWKRRAVIVEAGLKRIAASMNGMPHGSGKIQANNFPGHFCLHFQGSKVHKSSRVDPAHQMMIWKAAGQSLKPFMEADPREVLELVITAINQDDGELAALGIKPGESEDLWLINQAFLGGLPEIELINVKEKEGLNPEQAIYLVQVRLLYPGDKAKTYKEGLLTLVQDKPGGRWLMEGGGLIELLGKN